MGERELNVDGVVGSVDADGDPMAAGAAHIGQIERELGAAQAVLHLLTHVGGRVVRVDAEFAVDLLVQTGQHLRGEGGQLDQADRPVGQRAVAAHVTRLDLRAGRRRNGGGGPSSDSRSVWSATYPSSASLSGAVGPAVVTPPSEDTYGRPAVGAAESDGVVPPAWVGGGGAADVVALEAQKSGNTGTKSEAAFMPGASKTPVSDRCPVPGNWRTSLVPLGAHTVRPVARATAC